MLESLAASLLSQILSQYIENLNADRLKLNVISGQLELSNLRIRKDALIDTDLPFVVHR